MLVSRDNGRILLPFYRYTAQGAICVGLVVVFISGDAMTVVEILVILDCGRYKGARTSPGLIDVSPFLTLVPLRI